MDAVQASSFITPSKTEILLDKIADLGGSHRAELLQSTLGNRRRMEYRDGRILCDCAEERR